MGPPRACFQSVLIPIKNVIWLICWPKASHRNSMRHLVVGCCQVIRKLCAKARSSKQLAPFGSALRLDHRNSLYHSVLGYMPGHMLVRHVPELVLEHVLSRMPVTYTIEHVTRNMHRHEPKHILKHVPDHVLARVLKHVPQNRFCEPLSSTFLPHPTCLPELTRLQGEVHSGGPACLPKAKCLPPPEQVRRDPWLKSMNDCSALPGETNRLHTCMECPRYYPWLG